jgi:hypothetical protein
MGRDAWAALGKMSKEEAMARYVALVCAIDPEWNAAQRNEDVSMGHFCLFVPPFVHFGVKFFS